MSIALLCFFVLGDIAQLVQSTGIITQVSGVRVPFSPRAINSIGRVSRLQRESQRFKSVIVQLSPGFIDFQAIMMPLFFLQKYTENFFFTLPFYYSENKMFLISSIDQEKDVSAETVSYVIGDFITDSTFYFNTSPLGSEYLQIGIFIGFAIFLSLVIFLASYLLVTQKPESEKLSTYECGFEPYEDAKNRFDVQFYIVAILFVLFDIEIIVLLPWCACLSTVSSLGYWSMVEFLLELGLGFFYVWCVGALDW